MDAGTSLGQSALFAAATAAELEQVTAMSTPRRLRKGQLLFSEGEPSDQLYVIRSGRVKVLVSSSRGDELVLSVLGPGDAMGELSVLDEQPRSASAQALEDSELLALPSAALRDLLRQSPTLAISWAQELSATVRRLTGSTGDLVFLDLPRRLAKLLLEADGEADTHGHAVELGGSQAEVAARLGVARQSLNRALGSLQQRGWLRVDGPVITLRDRAALEHFAGS